MKKTVLLVGLVAAGFAAYWLLFSPAAETRRACNRLEALCGVPTGECVHDMREATPAEVDELRRCIEPAESCLETVGCVAGVAMRQLGKGAMRGLLR